MSVRAKVPAPASADGDVTDDADTVLAQAGDDVFDVDDAIDDATISQLAEGSEATPGVPTFIPPPGWVPPPPTPAYVPTPAFVPTPGWVPPPANLAFPPAPSENSGQAAR